MFHVHLTVCTHVSYSMKNPNFLIAWNFIRCTTKVYPFSIACVIWKAITHKLLFLVQVDTADHTLQADYVCKIVSIMFQYVYFLTEMKWKHLVGEIGHAVIGIQQTWKNCYWLTLSSSIKLFDRKNPRKEALYWTGCWPAISSTTTQPTEKFRGVPNHKKSAMGNFNHIHLIHQTLLHAISFVTCYKIGQKSNNFRLKLSCKQQSLYS